MIASFLGRWTRSPRTRRPASLLRRTAKLAVSPLEARDVPAVVSNLNDSGAGSLRQAILTSNALSSTPETITFSVTGTITLASALPAVTDDLTITGPGAASLTVNGGGLYRVFQAADTLTTTSPTFNLNNLTVANGATSVTGGGGLQIVRGTTTVNGVLFNANKVVAGGTLTGGAVAVVGAGVGLVVSNSTFTANGSAFFNVAGGAIGVATAATNPTVSISGSLFGNNLTSANGSGGALSFSSPSSGSSNSYAISNSTITNSFAQFGGGIALSGSAPTTLTLMGVLLTANTGLGQGGGLYLGSGSATVVTVADSTVSNNTVPGTTGTGNSGGGLYLGTAASLTITNTDFTGNVAQSGGALNVSGVSTTLVDRSLFRNNVATASTGGAVALSGATSLLGVTNTTFTGNTAPGGAALTLSSFGGGTAVLENSTVVGNVAGSLGAAIYNEGTSGALTLTNTVVAGNAGGTAPDLGYAAGGFTITANNSFVGVADDPNVILSGSGNVTGTYANPARPGLSALGNTGGSLPSYRPLAGSPLIDAGTGTTTTLDQRGKTRTVGAATDIGAVEVQAGELTVPGAFVSSAPLVTAATASTTPYSLTVAYGGISTPTLATGNVVVTGPNGFSATPTYTTNAATANGVAATYTFVPPASPWTGAQQGTYTVSVGPTPAKSGTNVAVPAGSLGTFAVALPTTFTVTTTADSGPGSLRAAVAAANAVAGTADTIAFSLGGAATIVLSTGELSVTDSVTITGPGADSLTVVNTRGNTRLFNLDGPGTLAVAISGLTLTGGSLAATAGGAILDAGETLSLTGVRITRSTASVGGALAVTGVASVSLTDTTLQLNGSTSANSGGGAVNVASGASTLTVTRGLFGQNTAAGSGGGLMVQPGNTLTVADSLFVGNVVAGTGGGAYLVAATTTLTQTTFVSNVAASGGGAIRVQNAGAVAINNSTIVSNAGGTSGGGISSGSTGASGPVSIYSSVVAGNTGSASPNLALASLSSNPQTINYSALDSTVGTSATLNATNIIGGSYGLLPLANNGGPLQTVYVTATSALLNKGDNALGLTLDARGLPRVVGGTIDIGATERDVAIPVASASPAAVTAAGTASVTVTYTDPTIVNGSTVNTGDIVLVGPSGAAITPTFTGTAPANGGTVTATYTFPVPAVNGTYAIRSVANQVFNTAGTPVPAGAFGSIDILVPQTFTVTTNADSGPGSLRAAAAAANASLGADSIVFNAVAFPGGQTITLTSGELAISDSVTITAPAGGVTLLNAASDGRIFNINGPGTLDVSLKSLTLTGGSVASTAFGGGAIYVTDEKLTISNSTITGNRAIGGTSFPGQGGGIFSNGAASITITNSVVTNNEASGSAGFIYLNGGNTTLSISDSTLTGNRSYNTSQGGVVNANSVATVTFTRDLISDNKAYLGAVVYGNTSLTLTFDTSSVVNNAATASSGASTATAGGVMAFNSTATVVNAVNSTFAGNTAAQGGVARWASGITFTASYSTFALNSASVAGGAFSNGTSAISMTLNSSLVAGNTAGTGPDFNASTLALTGANSAVGTYSGTTTQTFTGTAPLVGLDYRLRPITALGGVGPVVPFRVGSPLQDAAATTALTTDGRGPGFPRTIGSKPDIGAFERMPGPDVATATAANVTTSGGGSYTFTVTYADDSTAKLSGASLGGNTNAVTVVGTSPSGATVPLTVTVAAVSPGGDNSAATVTYTATPPGGTWDAADLGTYTVSLVGGQVNNTAGAFVTATPLTTFNVAFAQPLVVTNTLDDGSTGSLRWAVNIANNIQNSVETIQFAPGLGTISVTSPLPITDGVIVNGKVNGNLTAPTLTGGAGVFYVNGTGVLNVQFNDLTFAGAAAAQGAVVLTTDESVTFTGVQVLNNTTNAFNGNRGGAVTATGPAVLTFTDSTVSGNTNASNIGESAGITLQAGGKLTVTRTLFENNTAPYAAAISASGLATTTITDSLFGSNTGSFSAGAVRLTNVSTITGSTFTGNTNAGTGYGFAGAIWLASPTAVISNSTIVDNAATGSANRGGGIYIAGNGSLLLRSTVVANNTAVGANTGRDIYRTAGSAIQTVSATNSIIGVSDDGNVDLTTDTLNQKGSKFAPLDPLIGSLAFNGGTLQTRLPLPGSPAINAGSNPLGLTLDARGATYPRERPTGLPDVGAVEVNATPGAKLNDQPAVSLPGVGSVTFSVTYADDAALNAATLANNKNAVSVTGPGGALTITAASIGVNTNGTPRTVTYTAAAPGAAFVPGDNGTYTVSVNDSQAFNTGGAAVAAGPIGQFTVAVPVVYVVTNTLDDGSTGSLRWAITQANVFSPNADSISFQPGLTGTITLTDVLPTVSDSLTIDGKGATITVDGGGTQRAFEIDGAGTLKVAFNDFTVQNTFTGNLPNYGGAALATGNESVTLTRMVFQNNRAEATIDNINGGAVYANGNATITVVDSKFTGNSIAVAPGFPNAAFAFAGGGAIAATGVGTVLNVSGSTFTGNSANNGGAISLGLFNSASATITNSLFANNTATSPAGGRPAQGGAFASGGQVTITNTTFSGNTATGSTTSGTGGGALDFSSGTINLTNVTLMNNASTGSSTFYNGGAIRVASALLTITSSVIGLNTSAQATGGDIFTSPGGATVAITTSLIGQYNSGFSNTTGATGNATGSAASPLNPQVGPLANNGGPTLTHALLNGSAARDLGATTAAVTTDQRGAGFVRVANGKVDAGAFEVQQAGTGIPTAALFVQNVTTRKATSYAFTVVLNDDAGIDTTTVQGTDFTVTGPNGFSTPATLGGLSTVTLSRTASLTFSPPGGTWNAFDNGVYTVTLTGAITDGSANPVGTGVLGTFTVAAPVAVESIVTKLSDGTSTPLSGQRSVIPNLVITFDGLATGADLAAAYKLVNTSANSTVALTASTTTVGGKTVATLTPVVPLANAFYSFTALGTAIGTANVAPVAANLDGNNDGTAGGDYVLAFHRFAGDVTGDTAVDGDDLAALAAAFNSVVGDSNYVAFLDLDSDGAVDGNDLAIFAQSFNIGIL